MKEKISTFLTISAIFSLFVYYKVVKSSEVISSNQNTEIIEYDIVIDDINDEKDNKEIQVNIIIDEVVENNCSLEINETHNFKFSSHQFVDSWTPRLVKLWKKLQENIHFEIFKAPICSFWVSSFSR